MTRNGNARLAGFAYLFYIAVAAPLMAIRGDQPITHLLGFLSALSALTLAVTLFALTRDQDRDLAMLGLTCRVAEGIVGAVGKSVTLSASFFAVGSTIFCWLLLRGRMIPQWLAWVGFLGSALIAVVLPVQLTGVARASWTQAMWAPIALFEITVAIWWLIKGDTARPAPATHPL